MTIGELVQAATFSGAGVVAVRMNVQSLSGKSGRKVLKALRGDSASYEAPIGDTAMGKDTSTPVLHMRRLA